MFDEKAVSYATSCSETLGVLSGLLPDVEMSDWSLIGCSSSNWAEYPASSLRPSHSEITATKPSKEAFSIKSAVSHASASPRAASM